MWKFKEYVVAGIPLEDIPGKYMTQLTPEGLVYTLCWLLFFSAALEKLEENDEGASSAAGGRTLPSCNEKETAGVDETSGKRLQKPARFLDTLSEYSMIIYLIHPLFLYYWYQWFGMLGFEIARVPVLLFYVLVLITSLLAGMGIHKIAKRWKPIGLLLLGRQPK